MNVIREPMLVSAVADFFSVSRSTIRRWIRDGHLKTDTKAKRVTVVSGDVPLSPSRFQELVRNELSFARPGTIGFDADGAQILIPGTATIIKIPLVAIYSQAQANARAVAARIAQP